MSEERIEIRNTEDLINALFEINKELREENEQLRQQIALFDISDKRFEIVGMWNNDTLVKDKETERIYNTISTNIFKLLNILNEAKESWKEVAEKLQEENEELKQEKEKLDLLREALHGEKV